MSNEYQSTSINPDVFEQFFTLLNTHCKSSEAALAMLSTLCYELMRRSGIHSLDSLMLNGEGILIQLQGADIRKRAARTVLTGMCYSVGSATRQGSSSPTRFIGQSAMTSRT